MINSFYKGGLNSANVRTYIILKYLNASTIASSFSGVGCLRGFLSVSTAFGASYIGNPKLRFTSAIKAVWTLKPYLDSMYACILLYVGLGSYLAVFNIHFHFYFVRSFYTGQEGHNLHMTGIVVVATFC